jgi:hypothetical protein
MRALIKVIQPKMQLFPRAYVMSPSLPQKGDVALSQGGDFGVLQRHAIDYCSNQFRADHYLPSSRKVSLPEVKLPFSASPPARLGEAPR